LLAVGEALSGLAAFLIAALTSNFARRESDSAPAGEAMRQA